MLLPDILPQSKLIHAGSTWLQILGEIFRNLMTALAFAWFGEGRQSGIDAEIVE